MSSRRKPFGGESQFVQEYFRCGGEFIVQESLVHFDAKAQALIGYM